VTFQCNENLTVLALTIIFLVRGTVDADVDSKNRPVKLNMIQSSRQHRQGMELLKKCGQGAGSCVHQKRLKISLILGDCG
jgi:hypothetical protein